MTCSADSGRNAKRTDCLCLGHDSSFWTVLLRKAIIYSYVSRLPFALLTFGGMDDAVVSKVLGNHRPGTNLLVLPQITLGSLEVHMISGSDLCADLEKGRGTRLLETRACPFKGPIQVLA